MTRTIQYVITFCVLVALAAAPFWAGSFTITLLNYIGIYALVALGIVLLTGVGGLTSFGQAAFVGIGAYATAWLTTVHGASPWLGLGFALGLTSAIAALLGAVTLRLGGHFLPLSTIAWGLSIFYLFGNLDALGRYNGITGVPPISIGSISFAPSTTIYYLIWGLLAGSAVLVANLLDSREGRAIRSLRGGTVMIESLGVSAFRIRLVTFIIAALLAGLSGWLYAHMSRYVSPAPFDVRMGIEYLFMAIVGGSGHILGAVIGAAIITLLKNTLQDVLPYFSSQGAQLEIIVFAVLFILVLQFARRGVVPYVRRLLPKGSKPALAAAEPLERRTMPERGTPLLKVDNLVKRFGGLVAVNQVGFEVRAGEIVALIGPNGAGKSTMFNLITGALESDSGKVSFLGQDITGVGQRRIAKAGIARTFQHVKLRPNMSLLDNVLLGTYLRTHSGFLTGALRLSRNEEARARFEALTQLKRVGLGENPYELAGNLPLGSQRILEVARALAADPALVVLDEPAAGLRRLEKLALADLLRGLRTEGVTILIVEHDMDFVMGLVDRLVVMDFGSKLTEGPPSAVRSDTRVQEAYLGGVA
ncbi:branched-chain amino acid ABC transporter ATP-binding protein/permease [Microvirga yunnanensis]|uniref:branched-chain amino acid ABC transporter ATP-binding protein/permease n=1 Tax=Microvirga yunnanensis TaxID=2953740 RepID=UPI0021C82B2A|nr:branched-chain amino acid ABC transporter ATP-binding protein/permease [Microvirga sp. HBU65207]